MSRTVTPLSAAQLRYIRQAEYLPVDLRELASISGLGSDGRRLEIDSVIADRYESAFALRLAQVGFDADYELTEEGAILEEMIDAFADRTG